MTSNSKLFLIARVPECRCILMAQTLHDLSPLPSIRDFLYTATADSLLCEIANEDEAALLRAYCPHRAVLDQTTRELPPPESIRRADELYDAIRVMRAFDGK